MGSSFGISTGNGPIFHSINSGQKDQDNSFDDSGLLSITNGRGETTNSKVIKDLKNTALSLFGPSYSHIHGIPICCLCILDRKSKGSAFMVLATNSLFLRFVD